MARDPIELLVEAPEFKVEVLDMQDNGFFDNKHYSRKMGVPGGEDYSPGLTWSGAPEETKSYTVMIYDPDAPPAGGFWHWSVANVPSEVTELAAGAGKEEGTGMPIGSVQYKNDGGFRGYIGAAPPEGETHRYFVIITALDVEKLDVPDEATPNSVHFTVNQHTIGRAVTIIKGSNPVK